MLNSTAAFQSKQRAPEPCYPNEGPDIAYYHEVYEGGVAALLPPLLWIHTLAFLAPQHRPATACSFFAELAEDEDLWRRFCMTWPPSTPAQYHGSWRNTAVWWAAGSHERKSIPNGDAMDRGLLSPLTQPALPEGACSLGLPLVQTLQWDELGEQRFASKFAEVRQPVLVREAISSVLVDPAAWSLESLRRRHGATTFQCVCHEPGNPRHRQVRMRLEDYLDYAAKHCDLEPLYLFDAELPEELSRGVCAPQFLGRNHVTAISGKTMFLGSHRWLAVGARGTGTRIHVDPISTLAWNLVVEGRKRWILLPPTVVHPPGLSWRQSDGALIAPGAALWLRDIVGDTAQLSALKQLGALEVEQGPGELIFVPHGWWHLVVNLEPTVAYTENCVTDANLADVLTVLSNLDPSATNLLRTSVGIGVGAAVDNATEPIVAGSHIGPTDHSAGKSPEAA